MGRATQRSIEILELVAEEEGRWTHAEIARRLGIPKSSLTDLLKDLIGRQYLELDATGEHLVGPRSLVIARSYLRRMDIVPRSRDVLLKLCEAVDEAASVAVRRDTDILVVAQERPTKPLVAAMMLGDRAPMVATAAGKSILAHLDEISLSEIIDRSDEALGPRREAPLRLELQRIRDGGLAKNTQEWMEGISAIALPIVTPDGPVAAIAVAAPASRVSDAWIALAEPHLRRAAEDLTLRMGGAVSARAAAPLDADGSRAQLGIRNQQRRR